MKTSKNAPKKTIKFDRKCKNAKYKFYQQIYSKLRNKGEGGGGGKSVLLNYPSLLSNIFPLGSGIARGGREGHHFGVTPFVCFFFF